MYGKINPVEKIIIQIQPGRGTEAKQLANCERRESK